MNSSLDIWSLLYALGVLQGIIMIFIMLLLKSANRTGNLLLAAMVGVLTLILLEEFFEAAHLFTHFPKLLLTTFPLDMAFGPLIYLYALSLVSREGPSRALLHLLPVAMVTAAFLLFHFGTERGAFVWVAPAPTRLFVALVNLKILYIALYFYTAVRTLRLSNTRSSVGLPYNNEVHINGTLITLRIVFILILIIYTNFNLNVLLPGYFWPSDLLSSLVIVLCIYALVVIAIRFPFVFTALREPASYLSVGANDEKPGRYKSSSLTAAQKKIYLDQLFNWMKVEKPFRNQQLKVEDLAEQLNIPAHHVSQIINEVLDKNFYEFVNYYRVQEVQEMINDPAQKHKSMLGIALDAGFNSKATFNRVFKEFTGMTPSTYKSRLQASDKFDPSGK